MLALARKLAGRQSRIVDVDFHVLGEIRNIEPIAANLSIRERKTLKVLFGGRRWRKLKGVALVRFPSGEVRLPELHWFDAHGVECKMKVRRVLD